MNASSKPSANNMEASAGAWAQEADAYRNRATQDRWAQIMRGKYIRLCQDMTAEYMAEAAKLRANA